MPALPALFQRVASAASDTRVLDSRQLRDAVPVEAHALLERIPAVLESRQSGSEILAIPTQYAGLDAGPAPGAVVGIILGSIAGFLLLMWLLWAMSQSTGFTRASTYEEEEVVVRRRSRSPTSRRSHRTEMRSRTPPPRRDRVIRTERIIRDSAPPPREVSRVRETIIVDDVRSERRVEGDDIVEVIEEHSSIGVPPPRRKSRRSSGYR